MEPAQTSQVAVAGLIFALLSFLTVMFAGVYMLYYKKSDCSHNEQPLSYQQYATPPFPSMYRAAPPQQAHAQSQQHASLSASFNQLPPQPMATPSVQTLSGAYGAPRIPPGVRSGPVGTFFDDELTQP